MIAKSNPTAPSTGKRSAQPKQHLTLAEKLTTDEVATLRLDPAGLASFEQLRGQIKRSREEMQLFDGEDVAAMEDARHVQFCAARDCIIQDNTAFVHFLAPRVMKLRDGEAKRKWRSIVTKLQTDAKQV